MQESIVPIKGLLEQCRSTLVAFMQKSAWLAQQDRWFWIFLTLLVIVKLWLVSYLRLSALYLEYDDYLYLQQAEQIISGNWLGPFTNLTLLRGPFYPLFIAINFWLGTPFLFLEQALYCLSAICLIFALKPLCKSKLLLLLIFALVLFNPMTYTAWNMTRISRAGIFPAMTILVLSGAIGMLANYAASFKKLLLWAIGLGVALTAFWLTRDQGILMVPGLLVLLAAAVILIWLRKPDDWKGRLAIYLLPVGIWAVLLTAVATVNLIYYKKFCIVEMHTPEFNAAYGALSRVKHKRFVYQVPVPKETRLRIYEVSPAFAELRPYLEGRVGERWAGFANLPNHEIPAIFNALLDAAAAAGYYKDASTAADYYKRLAREVNEACDSGGLECIGKRNTMAPPWEKEYWPIVTKDIFMGMQQVVMFKEFKPKSDYSSSVPWMDLEGYFADLTNNPVMPKAQWHIQGWVFNPKEQVRVILQNKQGEVIQEIALAKSPDVYEHFLKEKADFPGAKQAAFDLMLPNAEYQFMIKVGGRTIRTLLLDGSITWISDLDLYFNLSKAEQPGVLKNQSKLAEKKRGVLENVGKIYQSISAGLLGLAILIYSVMTAYLFRDASRNLIIWSVLTAIGCGLVISFAFWVYINTTMLPAFRTHYLAPLYPMLLIFIGVSWLGLKNLVEQLKKKTNLFPKDK